MMTCVAVLPRPVRTKFVNVSCDVSIPAAACFTEPTVLKLCGEEELEFRNIVQPTSEGQDAQGSSGAEHKHLCLLWPK